jgi:hypothetical protein
MYYDSTQSYLGYTLFAPMNNNVVYMIDNQGRLVHSWSTSSKPELSVFLLENGSLLHSGRIIDVRDWDNNVTWSFTYQSDSFRQTHDIVMLPNGHLLLVCQEHKSVAAALTAGRNPAILPSNGLTSAYLVEVDTVTNQIVWQWHAWDHLVQDYDSTHQNYGVVRNHPELIDINYGIGPNNNSDDFIHFNGVDYNPDLDQIIVSPRIYSEVWVIDHSTTTEQAAGHTGGRYGQGGDLLYRWGNPETYDRGNPLRHRLYFQHNPSWIPDSLPGAGHMMVFSNGGQTRRWSSVEEWIPPTDSPGFYSLRPDSTFGPEIPYWWFRDSTWFYSSHIGGAQRLPNGNTLICEGQFGTFFEVTPDSQVVWKYISPVDSAGPMHQGESLWEARNRVFRCYRYGPDYSAFQGHTLMPGDPIEIYPPAIHEQMSNFNINIPIKLKQINNILYFSNLPDIRAIEVYSITGARIKKYHFSQTKGIYSLNMKDQKLAQGIYLYLIKDNMNNFLKTGKIIFIK